MNSKAESTAAHISAVDSPTNLELEKSLMFFHAYMYGPLQGKLRLYGARRIRVGSIAMSSDWEVFASMLVDDLGTKLGAGIDLSKHEVKSAKRGSSYEYQYHRNTGLEKIVRDMAAGHLFFEHDNNLREVELRYLDGSELRAEYFEKWHKELQKPYKGQRFRKSIPYNVVKTEGRLLMKLQDGEVVYPAVVSRKFEGIVPGEENE